MALVNETAVDFPPDQSEAEKEEATSETADKADKADDEKKADMADRYNVSKLMEILLIRHMTQVLIKDKKKYPVVINCVTPGLCKSELVKDMGLAPVVFKKLLGRPLEVGSRLLVNATALPDSQGEYIIDDHVSEPSPLARSAEGADKDSVYL